MGGTREHHFASGLNERSDRVTLPEVRLLGTAIAGLALASALVSACGREKLPTIHCYIDFDCPEDQPRCDSRVTECADGFYASTGGVCRDDLRRAGYLEACTLDSDCVEFACVPCRQDFCPTCAFPIAACGVGPGFCDSRRSFLSSVDATCPPPCDDSQSQSALIFTYIGHCPN